MTKAEVDGVPVYDGDLVYWTALGHVRFGVVSIEILEDGTKRFKATNQDGHTHTITNFANYRVVSTRPALFK